jgi:hypothetical protein
MGTAPGWKENRSDEGRRVGMSSTSFITKAMDDKSTMTLGPVKLKQRCCNNLKKRTSLIQNNQLG